ncbi:hypothetical protein Btru_043756 [Bulinus truncatus]|nr:hypothetical protein Btru_043756 [Bulinus truncatus]
MFDDPLLILGDPMVGSSDDEEVIPSHTVTSAPSVHSNSGHFKQDNCIFVDQSCRKYNTWDEWKRTNGLPSLIYAYPTHGCYTCSGDQSVKFDLNRGPNIEFWISPNNSQLRDDITNFISMGSWIKFLTAELNFLEPICLKGGASSSVKELARNIAHLIDKGKHEKHLDSLILLIKYSMRPTIVDEVLEKGAQDGVIFSNAQQEMADTTAQENIQRFLDRNHGNGGIMDMSKLIRTVNRMIDPNKFCSLVPPDSEIDIGHNEKFIVTDTHGGCDSY